MINASNGLTALWVLLAGIGFVVFIIFPVRWSYRWLAKKSGSLDAGTPSAMMMTVTIVMVLISGFYTDIIGIHAIFVSVCLLTKTDRADLEQLGRIPRWPGYPA